MSRYIDADKFERECMFDKNCNDMQDMIYKLRDYPAADVRENVRGEWLPHPNKSFREWDVCSACGTGCKRREYGMNDDGIEWMTEYSFSYCPNCGADMRGDKS